MADDSELLGWCVVANVAAVTHHGPGGADVESGLKHFSAGTRLWVLPTLWGDGGEDLFVVGVHRGRRGGYVRMVLKRKHLVGFRVKAVYSPAVHRELSRPWGDRDGIRTWASEEEAQHFVDLWRVV